MVITSRPDCPGEFNVVFVFLCSDDTGHDETENLWLGPPHPTGGSSPRVEIDQNTDLSLLSNTHKFVAIP